EAVVREVQESLGDAVLQEAVRRMPPEYYEIVGPRMLETLRRRRSGLASYAERYYAMLAREAEVWGTDRPELADILRNADGATESDKPFVPVVDDLGDQRLDWTTSTGPALWVSAEPDLGVLLGLRLQRTAYGFRKYPYRYQQSIGATYSTALGAWRAEYRGDFL